MIWAFLFNRQTFHMRIFLSLCKHNCIGLFGLSSANVAVQNGLQSSGKVVPKTITQLIQSPTNFTGCKYKTSKILIAKKTANNGFVMLREVPTS